MDKPNVVIIMTDQHQAGLCRREGFALNTMPFLDALAQEGVSFARAYTPSPICTPARISLLTGRYPSAHEVKENSHGLKEPNFPDPWIVVKDEVTYDKDLFDLFEKAGYQRALVGKTHAHLDNDNFDFVRSFHHRGGFYEGITADEVQFGKWVSSRPYGTAMEPNPFPKELEIPHRMVSAAIEWVEAHKDEPFAL
jgi:arylsulfatase A-like enzyme